MSTGWVFFFPNAFVDAFIRRTTLSEISRDIIARHAHCDDDTPIVNRAGSSKAPDTNTASESRKMTSVYSLCGSLVSDVGSDYRALVKGNTWYPIRFNWLLYNITVASRSLIRGNSCIYIDCRANYQPGLHRESIIPYTCI